MHLAAVLRITASNRDVVTGWNEALITARNMLLLNGDDPEDVLCGLI